MIFTVISKKKFSKAFLAFNLVFLFSLMLFTLILSFLYSSRPLLSLIVISWQAGTFLIFYLRRISPSASNPLYLIFSILYLIYFMVPVSFYPIYSVINIYLGSSMSYFSQSYLTPDYPALLVLAVSSSLLLISSSYTQSIKLISAKGRSRLNSFLSYLSSDSLFFVCIIASFASIVSSLFFTRGLNQLLLSELLNLFFFDITIVSISLAWIYFALDGHLYPSRLRLPVLRGVSFLCLFILLPGLIGGSKGTVLLLITRLLLPLFSLPYILSLDFIIVPATSTSLLLACLAPFFFILGDYFRYQFIFAYKQIYYSDLRNLDITSLAVLVIDRLSAELNNAYLLTEKALGTFLGPSLVNISHAIKTSINLILPGTYFDGFSMNTSNLLLDFFTHNVFYPVFYDSRQSMIDSLNTQPTTIFGDSVIYFGSLGFLLIPFCPFIFSYFFSFFGRLGFFGPALLFPTASCLFLISYGVDTGLKVATLFIFSLFTLTLVLYSFSFLKKS